MGNFFNKLFGKKEVNSDTTEDVEFQSQNVESDVEEQSKIQLTEDEVSIINSPESNGFISFDDQYKLYSYVIGAGISPEHQSILHIGSGTGEMVNLIYNSMKQNPKKYVGLDLNKNYTDLATKVYGSIENVEFHNTNIDGVVDEKFDWVIAPHSLLYKQYDIEDNQYILDRIEKMYELCNVGISLTVLNSNVTETMEDTSNVVIVNPSAIVDYLCEKYTMVNIRNTYDGQEYIIDIYKV